MSVEDRDLIERANAGDASAFEALYARHRVWVLRVAMRYAPDADAAQDVVQEVFLYWLRQFPGFRLTARVSTYLFPITRSIALTQQRRRARERPERGIDPDQLTVAATSETNLPEDLRTILQQLPAGQREVLLLRFVDGFTLEEIADALQIPTGTTKSRLHHALQTLRADPRTARYFEQ